MGLMYKYNVIKKLYSRKPPLKVINRSLRLYLIIMIAASTLDNRSILLKWYTNESRKGNVFYRFINFFFNCFCRHL